MPKYRKKPVVIEAWRYSGRKPDDPADADIPEWLREAAKAGTVLSAGTLTPDGRIVLNISTLEGIMAAHPGDWIIKGVQDELYPCDPVIFEATYEPVEG